MKHHQETEELRLGYVTFTRPRSLLLGSGHWWGPNQKRPRGPSAFLEALRAHCEAGHGEIEAWADAPEEDAENPALSEAATEQDWPLPLDPTATARRRAAAATVRAHLARRERAGPGRAAAPCGLRGGAGPAGRRAVGGRGDVGGRAGVAGRAGAAGRAGVAGGAGRAGPAGGRRVGRSAALHAASAGLRAHDPEWPPPPDDPLEEGTSRSCGRRRPRRRPLRRPVRGAAPRSTPSTTRPRGRSATPSTTAPRSPRHPGSETRATGTGNAPRRPHIVAQRSAPDDPRSQSADPDRPQPPPPPNPPETPALPGPLDATPRSLLPEERRTVGSWDRDLGALAAELRRARATVRDVPLPFALSASQLLRLAADPDGFARELARPMPRPPQPAARRGTRFHAWVESRFEELTLPLLGPDELPGADPDEPTEIADEAELEALKEAFARTPYAHRTPYRVEAPFQLTLAGRLIRGRIDAVYKTPGPDGDRFEIIDWKTGRTRTADPLQLAIYRLAWAERHGLRPSAVDAAFLHVRSGEVVRPARLPGRAGLERILLGETDDGLPPEGR